MARFPADLLTLAEAAGIAGVHPDSLRAQIHNERLEAEKRGRDWFVSRRELQRYLDGRAPQGRPPKSGKKREQGLNQRT